MMFYNFKKMIAITGSKLMLGVFYLVRMEDPCLQLDRH
jgi:hypothetical protein